MAGLVQYKWVYMIFVVVTFTVGVLGIRALKQLVNGKPKAYMNSIIALVLGIVTGVVRMGVSRSLRGKSMPVDMVVYITAVTLIILLIFRIPAIREKVDFVNKGKDDKGVAGDSAAMVMGMLFLNIHLFMGPTHTFGGGKLCKQIQHCHDFHWLGIDYICGSQDNIFFCYGCFWRQAGGNN